MKKGAKKGLTLKIIVIGPLQSGKSTVTNFLAERTDNVKIILTFKLIKCKQIISSYQPTVGVRIVECEKEAPKNPKKPMSGKVNIEFWDVSGDPQYKQYKKIIIFIDFAFFRYENCWPAIG